MAFTLSSPAFANNTFIPIQYTCDGDNISPPLTWTDVPDPFAEETFRASRIDRGRKDERALQWHRALLKLRREHPALQDDTRQGLRASAQGKALLMQRGPVLVVAAFDAQPSEARLPPGRWRVLLDSGAARVGEERLRFRGRGAVVLEQG